MSLSVADSGSNCTTLCSITHVLWKNPQDHTGQNNASQHQLQKCPSILPIHIQLPQSYPCDGKNWRLPPSFEATFLGVPALFVRCLYTLSVTITRTRSYRLVSWTTNKTCVSSILSSLSVQPWAPVYSLQRNTVLPTVVAPRARRARARSFGICLLRTFSNPLICVIYVICAEC